MTQRKSESALVVDLLHAALTRAHDVGAVEYVLVEIDTIKRARTEIRRINRETRCHRQDEAITAAYWNVRDALELISIADHDALRGEPAIDGTDEAAELCERLLGLLVKARRAIK